MLQKIRGFALRTAVRTQVAARRAIVRLRDEELGQSTWVAELMILGIVLLLAAAIFAFWKAGGMTWVNNTLNSITTY